MPELYRLLHVKLNHLGHKRPESRFNMQSSVLYGANGNITNAMTLVKPCNCI